MVPFDSRALALMLNVDFKKMPSFLQGWKEKERHYIGNPNLDNLDPLDWVIKNPWDGHSFGITVGMTRTEYNNLKTRK